MVICDSNFCVSGAVLLGELVPARVLPAWRQSSHGFRQLLLPLEREAHDGNASAYWLRQDKKTLLWFYRLLLQGVKQGALSGPIQ